MMTLLQSLPLWVLAAAVVIACVVGTGLGMMASHAFLRRRLTDDTRALASGMLGTVGTVYSLLIAFVAVQVWQDLSDAAASVEAEAASALEIVYDTQAFGPEETAAVRAALRIYLETVIREEWPILAGEAPCPPESVERISTGDVCPVARPQFVALLTQVGTLNPTDARQTIWLGQIVAAVNKMAEHRLSRIAASNGSLPGPFWFLLLVGGTLMMAYACLSPLSGLNAVLVAGLGASLGLVLFLIVALDSPFSGELGVKPSPFEMVLVRMEALAGSGAAKSGG